MKKTLFFSFLMLSLSGNSQTVVFDWAKQMGGSGWDAGTSIAVDASGNVYTTGSFRGLVDFDPGAGVHNLTSNGWWGDIFIQKLDANGNFLWVKQMSGDSAIIALTIALDFSGNVFTTGNFRDTVDFDPGVGVTNLISNGGADIFIQKLDANGNFLWAKQMGNSIEHWTSDDIGTSIALNTSGEVYTTGSFYDTVDFDPGPSVTNLISNGDGDVFIQKLDANGNFLWVKQMGGVSGDGGKSISLDAFGNVYTMGAFTSTVDFDPGVGVSNLTSNYPGGGSFLQKLDGNGNFLWAKQIAGFPGDFTDRQFTIDPSDNVYITGRFEGTVDFDPGLSVMNLMSNGLHDIFIQKLDANGNFIWAKQLGGVANDQGNSITTDTSGNVYTLGSYWDTVDFDPGASVSNLTSSGWTHNVFIQKLDTQGNFQWAKQIGGLGWAWGNSISVDASGSVYATGSFSDTVDFDPGIGVSNLTSNGGYDIFIQKLRVSGIGIIENDFSTEFLLYPNPTDGFFSIDLGKPYDATITITDLTGKTILSKSVENSQLVNLKLEAPAGVYLLIVESAEKKAVIKLVKE